MSGILVTNVVLMFNFNFEIDFDILNEIFGEPFHKPSVLYYFGL